MTNNINNQNEKFLDDAAAEAIGAHRTEESDAFTITLGQADDFHQQATRDLRDTVARMAGSAPYMEPPASLRGAILQATAPKSFKIEDYRRTSEVAPKWLRRSLVASIGFLIFAACYNASTKTAYDQAVAKNTALMEGIEKAKPQVAQLISDNHKLVAALSSAQQNLAHATLANVSAPRWAVKDGTGRQLVLAQDPASTQFLLMVPNQSIPPGQYAILSGMGSDGKPHELRALAIGKPDDAIGSMDSTPLASHTLDAQWKGLLTNEKPPVTAGMNPFDQH